MPLCKNCPGYYTGKEDTPRGRGYAAKYEPEGKKMKGKNGKMYVSKGNRWVRVSSSKKVTSPRLYPAPEPGELASHLRAGEMLKYGDDFDDEKLTIIDQIDATEDEKRALLKYPLHIISMLLRSRGNVVEEAERLYGDHERLVDEIMRLEGIISHVERERLMNVPTTHLTVLKSNLEHGREPEDWMWRR